MIISDTGPGVEEDDVNNLFSLFFTRKLRGGRCRPLPLSGQLGSRRAQDQLLARAFGGTGVAGRELHY